MHIQGATVEISRNRKGRKRKSGRRLSNGHLAAQKSADQRELVASQPHRSGLPDAYRFDFRGETYIGRLNIKYRTSESRNAKAGLSDEMHEAGLRYLLLVRSYLAMCNAPRLSQMRSLVPSTIDVESAPDTSRLRSYIVDDEALTERYMRAYEAVSEAAGRQGHMALNHVVIYDRAPSNHHVAHLQLALGALADHFGLTNRRKS